MIRNRKEQYEKKLIGVNRIADPGKLKLGIFQELQNFIPAKRYKIKKKRGVEQLVSEADLLTPSLCNSQCDDFTHVGQQVIDWSQYVLNEHSTTGNCRTSWSYIAEDGEVWTMTGDATCGGGNMSYSNSSTCCEILHYTDDGATLNRIQSPNLIQVPPSTTAINCMPGQADEPLYNIAGDGSGGHGFVYPVRDLRISLALAVGDSLGSTGYWLKNADNFYLGLTTALNTKGKIRSYLPFDTTYGQAASGASDDLPECSNMRGMTCTDDNIYVLYDYTGTGLGRRIAIFDRSDLALSGELINLGDVGGAGIHAYGDDTIYLMSQQNGNWAVYYWDGSQLVYGGHGPHQVVAFSGQSLHFRGRKMYFGVRGFGGGGTAIYRTEYPCDAPILVAEVHPLESSVARGGSVTASWSNILIPRTNDSIKIRPAPSNSYDTGYTGTSSGSVTISTPAQNGTISVPVSASLDPGDYILQFFSEGLVYVCRSEPFTVT